MLSIKDLHAEIDQKSILKGINLEIKPGEMHAIMGRNGSGKSTLSNVITGRENYSATKGSLELNNESILDWTPEKRSLEGIFMSFQYPVVIPGVNNTYFLKAALNAKRKYFGEKELDSAGFLKVIKENLKELDMDMKFLQRPVNQGFSGGEKKRYEILQMSILNPELTIFDETDSGLDVDALRIVTEGINKFKNPNNSFLIITHYQKLLDYIHPDYVHVMRNGKIVKSGDISLAAEIETSGYQNF